MNSSIDIHSPESHYIAQLLARQTFSAPVIRVIHSTLESPYLMDSAPLPPELLQVCVQDPQRSIASEYPRRLFDFAQALQSFLASSLVPFTLRDGTRAFLVHTEPQWLNTITPVSVDQEAEWVEDYRLLQALLLPEPILLFTPKNEGILTVSSIRLPNSSFEGTFTNTASFSTEELLRLKEWISPPQRLQIQNLVTEFSLEHSEETIALKAWFTVRAAWDEQKRLPLNLWPETLPTVFAQQLNHFAEEIRRRLGTIEREIPVSFIESEPEQNVELVEQTQ